MNIIYTCSCFAVTWSQISQSSQFPPRLGYAVSGSAIFGYYVLGGMTSSGHYLNDVWYSTTGGVCVLSSLSHRYRHVSVVFFGCPPTQHQSCHQVATLQCKAHARVRRPGAAASVIWRSRRPRRLHHTLEAAPGLLAHGSQEQ